MDANAHTARNRSNHTGFSLVELVLVIAIVAALSAIAVPRYTRSLGRYRVDLAAQRIVADLAYAQSEARRTSSSKTVTFDIATDTYSIAGVQDFGTLQTSYSVVLVDEPHRTTLTAASFDAAITLDLVNQVIFDGYGMPDSGGTIDISSGGLAKRIILDPETGKASIQ